MNFKILVLFVLAAFQATGALAMAPRSQPEADPSIHIEELVALGGRYDFLRQIDNRESREWGLTCAGVHRRDWMELVVTQDDVQVHPTGLTFLQVNRGAQSRDVRRSELDPRILRHFSQNRFVQSAGPSGESLFRVIRESKTCAVGPFGLEAGCAGKAFLTVDQVILDPQQETLTIPGSEGAVRRPTCVYRAAVRRR